MIYVRDSIVLNDEPFDYNKSNNKLYKGGANITEYINPSYKTNMFWCLC